MPENSAQERTEEATPRRRQEARRKGTVARSTDLGHAVVIAALLIVLPFAVGNLGEGLLLGFKRALGHIPDDLAMPSILGFAESVFEPAMLGLAPIVLVALAAGLIAHFAQVGFVLSGQAMNPSLSRISPFNGFKRLFSRASAFEGAKAVAKSALFAFLAFGVLRDHWNELLNLSALPVMSAVAFVGELVRSVLLKVAVAWLVLAAIDYYFQRKQVDKQLRMTKEELRQEMKDLEQSPELRAAIAQRRRKLMKGRLDAAIKQADVVVTNPTHYSVAIAYDPKTMHAPQVVAKGADYLALRIRELAAQEDVPLVPNPPLARQLYKKCDVGEFVPRDLFQAVAEVLAYVYTTLKRVKKS